MILPATSKLSKYFGQHLFAKHLLCPHQFDWLAETVFASARDSFLNSLVPTEREQFRACSNVKELLDGLRTLSQFRERIPRLEPCFQKINSFSEKLSPYFKIIEIVLAAHPEWANIALGSLRLVLQVRTVQLASHFTTFFEKLCKTIEKLSDRLPRYGELYDSLSTRTGLASPYLKDSLQKLYVDLFQFFEAVARVFSNKYGKIKRTPLVVADLMWKPFDLRFQTVLESINFHQKIVQKELEVSSRNSMYQELNMMALDTNKFVAELKQQLGVSLQGIQESYDDQARDMFLNSVTRWISSPDYKDRLEEAQQKRTEETTDYLFKHTMFKQWRTIVFEAGDEVLPKTPDTDSRQVLWISGNPGFGKTVLASSVIFELEKGYTGCPAFPPVVCYYFFTQTVNNHEASSNAIRALDIATHAKASVEELTEAISQCLPHLPNLYFVLDGIDECIDADILFKKLCHWCGMSSLGVAIFSRPDLASLRKAKSEVARIELTRDVVRDALTAFVKGAIREILEDGLLPEALDNTTITHHLAHRAEGMFLWVRLMVNYLKSPAMTKSQRMQLIMEQDSPGFDRLDEMYCRIAIRIESMDAYSKNLAHRALLWVAHSSLSSLELQEVLYPDGWDLDAQGRTEYFDHAIIVSCCGLLEKGYNGIFRYIHLSALQFARHGSIAQGGLSPLIPDASVAGATMALSCLSYLADKIPEGPLSGRLAVSADPRVLSEQYPFLKFATLTWIRLLIDTMWKQNVGVESQMLEDVSQKAADYLASPLKLMTWIESIYTFGDVFNTELHELRSAISDLERNSMNQGSTFPIHTLGEFLDDVLLISNEWGDSLHNNPAEIWGDVTMFTASRFLRSTNAAQRESLAPRLEREDRGGVRDVIKPTFSVAMSSSGGGQLAVLSIFPARAFTNGWTQQGDIPHCHGSYRWRYMGVGSTRAPSFPNTAGELMDACSGWLATYEIYDVGKQRSQSRHLVSIPLAPVDIEMCLRQSLRFSPLGHWKCNFPITIGPSLHAFTVLNRVIHIDIDDTSNFRTSAIPVSSLNSYMAQWSVDRPFGNMAYVYQVIWSPDGRYLAFTDGSYSIQNIAIFLMEEAAPYDPRLMNHHSMEASCEPLTDTHFHPTQDIFMFMERDIVYLWKFSTVCAKPMKHFEISTLSAMYHCDRNSPRPHPTVSFSHCGTSIAITYPGRPWPELIPLPGWSRADRKRKLSHENPPGCSPEEPRKRILGEDKSSQQVVSVLSRIQAPVITNSTMILSGETASTRTTILRTATGPGSVSICQSDNTRSQETAVVSLPNSIPREISATLTLPTKSNEATEDHRTYLTLAIAQAPENTYASDEAPLSTHLPIVIRKDIRALPAGSVRYSRERVNDR
ncbi:hypothetical protein F5B21DRAFT_507573 [Xylaria acuta]|nr:hypothetical protein F5B21DRAFT_507573 [Xylaria acuta]